MSVHKVTRPSDSPLIQRVSERRYLGGEGDVTRPDGARDIVVMRQNGQVLVMLTGNITRPIPLDFPAGAEVMNIMLAPDVFFTDTALAAPKMINESLLFSPAGSNKIWLGSEAIEIPTYDTAEAFIEKLMSRRILETDPLVARLVAGNPMAASERTNQRRFLQATGLTYKYFTQIERAWKAAALLQMGRPGPEVAFALGYTDQSHLIKSLKQIIGQTPSEIASSPVYPITRWRFFTSLETTQTD